MKKKNLLGLASIVLLMSLTACQQTSIKPNDSTTQTSPSADSNIKATKLEITGNSSMQVGEEKTLEVVATPSDAKLDLSFTSSARLIASVNSTTGVVKADAEGQATITVTDKISSLTSTFDITVTKAIEPITSFTELSSRISNVWAESEKEAGKISLIRSKTDTGSMAYNGTKTSEYSHYENKTIVEHTVEKYTNWNHQATTEAIYVIKQYDEASSSFFNITLNDDKEPDSKETSSASKYDVVDGSASPASQYTKEQAEEESSSPDVIRSSNSTIFSPAFSKINQKPSFSTEEENGLTVTKGTGSYLLKYAEGTGNDYSYYSVTAKAKGNQLVSFEYEEKTYESGSYDVQNDKLKDNAVVKSTDSVKYEATFGGLLPKEELEFKPNDYFMRKITEAKYKEDNTASIGSTIFANDFKATVFEPETALDSSNLTIKSLENEQGKLVVEEKNGTYTAKQAGNATFTLASKYYPSVTFKVTITVK